MPHAFSRCATSVARVRPCLGPFHGALLIFSLTLACADEPPEQGEGSTGSGPAGTEGSDPTNDAGDTTGTDPIDSSGTGDPAESSEGSDDTEQLPEPPDPVFVALADGGWTATSCDGGRTWVQQAFSDEIGDHTPWTAFGGLAFGNDGFVAGFGWGAPGHLLYSANGLDWEDLPADRFTDGGRILGYDAYTSGVAFDGQQFLVFSAINWRSTTGMDWEPAEITLPPGSDQLRQLRGFPGGVLVASLESQSGEGHPVGHFVAVSEDGGQTWTEGTGYASDCSHPIQHWGDIELQDGTLLVGTRDLCRSTDMGQTWELVVDPAGADIQDLFADAAGFGAVASSRVLHSDDGLAWSDVADVGTNLAKAAHGGGTWAAVSDTGQEFFWSDDGTNWQPGALETPPGDSVYIRDFAVGYPMAGCD